MNKALSPRTQFLSQWGGYCLAALGAFLFASKGIFVKLSYGYHIDAASLLALRMAFSTPFFILFGLISYAKSRSNNSLTLPKITSEPLLYVRAMFVGLLGYWVASYTDFISLKYLSVQLERLIIFTYPLFVIGLGALFFKHSVKMTAIWAFGISYIGLGFVFLTDLAHFGSNIITGTAWCMLSSLAFAFYLLLAKPLVKRMGASFFTAWAMSGAAIATFVQFFFLHKISDIHLSPPLLYLCLGLAIGVTVMPVYLMNFALSRISSQANAVIGLINPVFTLSLSAIILHESVSFAHIIGTALVLLGVGIYTYLDGRAPKLSSVSTG